MHEMMKKVGTATAASLVAATSILNADSYNEPSKRPEMRREKMQTLPARLEFQEGVLMLSADVLLWQAQENGLEYAITSSSSSALIDASARHPDFDWNWGFRVDLGYNMKHDGWGIFADYTRINSTARDQTAAANGQSLFLTWKFPFLSGSAGGTAATAKIDWNNHLNIVDLEIGRGYAMSKWLSLKPHFGVRTAWLDQENHRSATTTNVVINSVTQLADLFESKARQKYWGIGLRGALNTYWNVGAGFTIFGDAGMALLYGLFENNLLELATVSGTTSTVMNISNSFHIGRAMSDLQFGLAWDYLFDDDSYHFGIKAGWEHHMYFGQNQFMKFVSNTDKGLFIANQGDLTLQGVTLSVRFDF